MTTVAQIALPWSTRADHHCFGCAPGNPHGLGLTFTAEGPGLRTDFALGHHYESYPDVVHGGIVALICDETMGNLIVLRADRPAVTTSLRMRYVDTVHTGLPYRVTAALISRTPDLIGAVADVTDAHDDLVASATATYHPLPRSAS
ncbi:PaaI family thioesterase [Pseudonocardia parietis]|uniref:Acyl-coenzyme A thioesterase PaaI-like protein n=1 Tax=Pseudonocardia parietis TaxID=570936 RepID=A0ABS4W751_9PSEU|nr:PaaI family thioesterase [Pseudonocardia parietis]MBP2371816.1 acyl-coenzyme A thioesterase PaaI-like protein [Pseudonocardia parietis]